ncbi:MAG: peptidase M14 [Proteobacteria bacterium]|nr:peptidase M14 [Pseudomonadota bacterium]
MTRPARPSTEATGMTAAAPRRRRVLLVLPALLVPLLLAACGTSVPLPEWPAATPAPPGAATPALPAASSPASPQPNGPVPVQVTPISSAPSGASGVATVAPVTAPYGPAVAARFPDPAIVYSTPGLAAGRSSFTTNAEVATWLHGLARQSAQGAGPSAAVLPLGVSQRGAPIEALLVTRASSTDPATVLAAARPTVLLIAQQRGDAPAGCEALLVVARELLQGLLRPTLEHINVIVVPRANPDGAAAGTSTTADGSDLRHDHLLLGTPEAQALAQVAREYRPMVVVDLEEYPVDGGFLRKFGAIRGDDALLQYATTANVPEFVTKAAEEWFRRPVVAALKAASLSSDWYYSTSADPANLRVAMGSIRPDSERNVEGLENAVGLMIATRGVGLGRLHIQRRVHTDVTAVTAVLNATVRRANDLVQLRSYVERAVSAKACSEDTVIDAATTPMRHDLTLLDPNTGLDRTVTVDWDSALQLRPLRSRIRPCGYLLSAASATAAGRLRMLGLPVMQVTEPGTVLGESYRPSAPAQAAPGAAGTGAAPVIAVNLVRGAVDAAVGSYYVPVNQPLGSVAVAALEPDSPSSYFANHLLGDLRSTTRVMTVPTLALQDAR